VSQTKPELLWEAVEQAYERSWPQIHRLPNQLMTMTSLYYGTGEVRYLQLAEMVFFNSFCKNKTEFPQLVNGVDVGLRAFVIPDYETWPDGNVYGNRLTMEPWYDGLLAQAVAMMLMSPDASIWLKSYAPWFLRKLGAWYEPSRHPMAFGDLGSAGDQAFRNFKVQGMTEDGELWLTSDNYLSLQSWLDLEDNCTYVPTRWFRDWHGDGAYWDCRLQGRTRWHNSREACEGGNPMTGPHTSVGGSGRLGVDCAYAAAAVTGDVHRLKSADRLYFDAVGFAHLGIGGIRHVTKSQFLDDTWLGTAFGNSRGLFFQWSCGMLGKALFGTGLPMKFPFRPIGR
jgi:hypothetical protein